MRNECDGTRILVGGGLFAGGVSVSDPFEQTSGLPVGAGTLNHCEGSSGRPAFCTGIDTYGRGVFDFGLGTDAPTAHYSLCFESPISRCDKFRLTARQEDRVSWVRCTFRRWSGTYSARWELGGDELGIPLQFRLDGPKSARPRQPSCAIVTRAKRHRAISLRFPHEPPPPP